MLHIDNTAMGLGRALVSFVYPHFAAFFAKWNIEQRTTDLHRMIDSSFKADLE